MSALEIFGWYKKDPSTLKGGELYRGLIEPGWGAGLLNPAQEGEQAFFI